MDPFQYKELKRHAKLWLLLRFLLAHWAPSAAFLLILPTVFLVASPALSCALGGALGSYDAFAIRRGSDVERELIERVRILGGEKAVMDYEEKAKALSTHGVAWVSAAAVSKWRGEAAPASVAAAQAALDAAKEQGSPVEASELSSLALQSASKAAKAWSESEKKLLSNMGAPRQCSAIDAAKSSGFWQNPQATPCPLAKQDPWLMNALLGWLLMLAIFVLTNIALKFFWQGVSVWRAIERIDHAWAHWRASCADLQLARLEGLKIGLGIKKSQPTARPRPRL